MKYSELHYERINIEEKKQSFNELVTRFTNANTVEGQVNVILDANEEAREYQTYASMASLNFSRNINDEEAKKEKDYYDSIGPDMTEIGDKFDKVVNQSIFKSKKY